MLASDCPAALRAGDSSEQLVAQLAGVTAVLALAEAPQFVRLVEMASSSAFVERVAAGVRKRLELIDGAKDRRVRMMVRIEKKKPICRKLMGSFVKGAS